MEDKEIWFEMQKPKMQFQKLPFLRANFEYSFVIK